MWMSQPLVVVYSDKGRQTHAQAQLLSFVESQKNYTCRLSLLLLQKNYTESKYSILLESVPKNVCAVLIHY